MSKALRTVALIAGSVALIATGVGAVAGAKGLAIAGTTISAKTLSAVATYASVTAGVASVGAQLTAPKPIARGSPAQVTIDIEPPRPYLVGRVMTGGVVRHDVAYGPTLKKVPNPFRWQVRVLSGVGPIQGIVGEYFDFALIDNGYYGGFFNSVQSLGARPQATALVPPYGAAPGWTASSRLSGCAHVGLNFLFDRDGKVFAAGLPIYTALCDGELVYDPRQDSTYPGGSGPCRAGVESTYVYSDNPACHAVTYALGRFQNGIRVFGLGQPVDTIDMAAIVDWANDCDANGWTVNMVLQEGGTGANLREQRVRNLDDLCAAGGGRWYNAGGLLSFDWHRPRIALATLTDDDILEAGGGTDAVQTVRDRMNGVRPQYISPDHNWQQITAAEIVGTTYRTEDGGEKLTQVYPLNGVTNPAQAGELAAYAMADSREIGPMDIQAKAKWRFYRPGDCIAVDSSLAAYDGLAVINQRSLNPQTLAVALSLKSETPGKHDFALGKVADPPPTPVLLQTSEERDLLAAAAITPRAVDVEFDDGRNAEDLQPGEGGATRNVARGTYDALTTYVRGDEVIFAGSSYRLIVASSTGNAPPDVARWALLANAGSGPAGDDGLPGLTIIVSNEAHVVATNADGSGGDYSAAGGQMRVLRGDVVLTPTFSIPARTPTSPTWITIDSSGNYTVTDPGVDLATATIRANWAGVNYDRTYTLAKSKQGVTGPNLKINESAQAFTFTDGVANPASQTIELTAQLTNLSGTAAWSTTPAVTLGGTGNTRTLSVANFGANRQVTVEATLGGITDRITIVRLERDVSAPANANRVPLSRIEGGAGWSSFLGTVASITPIFPNVVDGRRYIVANATASAAGQIASIAGTELFPVQPNERLSVALNLNVFEISGPPPAFWQVLIDYFLGDTFVSSTVIFTAAGNIGGDALRQGFITVPTGVTRARLVLLAQSGGAGTFQLNILHPMVTAAAVGQTVHPPFTPGPVLTGPVDAGGPLLIGQLPVDRADPGLRNALVPLGNANRVPFSRMEGDRGWVLQFNGAGLPAPTDFGTFLGMRFFRVKATATALGQIVSIGTAPSGLPAFRLTPGERISVQMRVELAQPGAGNWSIAIWGFRGDGSSYAISAEPGSVTTGGVRFIANDPVRFFLTVPNDVVSARIELYGQSGAAGLMDLVLSEPMITSAAAGQTVHPPFTPGPNADDAADVTATAQRSIEPQFPAIEIKQGEAGHTGNRTVTHTALRATTALTGGTWSLPTQNLGAGSASINASTGTVTLSGIVQSGAYVARYTHTDGFQTDRAVPVLYVPSANAATRLTVGFQQIISRALDPGASNFLVAQIARQAGGTSGTISARIEQRQAGETTWNTVATGPGAPVSASEPGADNVSASFTNTTGAKRVFEFRVTEVRTPGTAGGAQVASETFLEG